MGFDGGGWGAAVGGAEALPWLRDCVAEVVLRREVGAAGVEAAAEEVVARRLPACKKGIELCTVGFLSEVRLL